MSTSSGPIDEVRAGVERLVERFRTNQDAYKNPSYNETQTRREFIDPFFKALGWDVDNEAGYAEAYKDVIHEDAIKVGGMTKAPDYCFRIGGQRKFFVEAKKPSVDMKNDPDPYYQLRRYAFSAKLPLSIITDFEELAVVDCRTKPSLSDKASKGRIRYWYFEEYLDNLEEIYDTFSKEAVLKGSFDRYIASARAKRGTGEVDKEFLKEIEAWRELLAKNIALRNPMLTQRELNMAVQLTIDRIIFLRICEDRGIEDYGVLQGMQNGTNVYARLSELFQRADERYNSGLFHFKEERGNQSHPDELTPGLTIDDKPLKQILKGLYYPDSPYEFSVLPVDILGQVYEQFLGKVIRLTAGHRAVIEDKPEVKKAGGVYYTPTYIVDYIVKNTVGELLKGSTPTKAAKLRILDPACGSGSFLIGAFEYLMDWHRDWYTENDPEKWAKGKQPRLFEGKNGWQLTTSEKKRILLNNIYGVDIDSQAVEVTKLSLLLKVLEEESAETIGFNLKLFHERALPDLGNNIKCGNSLIGTDFYEGQQMALLDEEELLRINPFDWETEFPEVFSGKNPGFDAVIGNPPYGAYLFDTEKSYLVSKYKAQSYQLDSYLLFLEKSVENLIVGEGLFGMIIPNPWLTNLLQRGIRRFVTTNVRIIEIAHFFFKVFPKVTVDNEIVILQKADPKKWKTVVTLFDSSERIERMLSKNLPTEEAPKKFYHLQKKWRDLDGAVINIFISEKEEIIATKCSNNGVSLEDLFSINVGIKPYQKGKGKHPQTKQKIASRPFDSDHKVDGYYRPYLRGKDIDRYRIVPLESRFIKYGPWLAEPRPAANFDAPIKIVMRQTGDSLVAALDTHQYLCLNNMHVLVPKSNWPSPNFVLGVINSELMNWYYHTLNPEVGEALAEVKKTNVAKLPIYMPESTNSEEKKIHDQMVELVEQMLELNKQLQGAKTAYEKDALQRQIDTTDRQIDQLGYKLYDLTDEEIKIVEGVNKQQ